MQDFNNDKFIFGSLNFDLIKYIGIHYKNDKLVFKFVNKNLKTLYCDRLMLSRILTRLNLNNSNLNYCHQIMVINHAFETMQFIKTIN
jgi:hypothetical protein